MPASIDRRSPLGAAWTALWADTPGRLAYALRLTLVCCGSGLIALWFEIPDAALIVYLSLFLNRPDRTSSLMTAMVMQLLITILVVLLVPLAALLINAPFWRTMAMAGLSFCLMFLASASKLRPFAASLALITAYVLDLLGSLPGGELATRGLLYGWLFVAVPASVSALASLVLAPSPKRLAGALLARALISAADVLDRPGHAARLRFQKLRREVALDTPVLLKRARMEGTVPSELADAFRSATAATMRILAAVDLLDRLEEAEPRGALAAAFTPTLRAMAGILADGGYPVAMDPPAWPEKISAEIAPLLATLSHAIAGFTTTAPPAARTANEPGFFAPDAFSDATHTEYALKVTMGAMACYLLFVLWDWPGIHTAMITCYIVGLGTAAETIEKLSLRIGGCLIGAALGLATIVYVLPGVTTITGILLVIAAGMLPASWVAAGDRRISYAGFQFAFAFLLCTLQGHGPGFDLSIARDRVLGVLLGTGMSYLVFTRVWPVSVSRTIDPALARLIETLRRVNEACDDARAALMAKAMTAGTELRYRLELTPFEPLRLRPGHAWIQARSEVIDRLDHLESPLMLARPEAGPALDAVARDAAALCALQGEHPAFRSDPPAPSAAG